MRRSEQQGSTLVLVLIVGTLLALLAFTTAGVATRGSDESLMERDKSDLVYRAEAAAEALRLEVVNHQRNSGYAAGAWMNRMRQDWDYYQAGSGSPVTDWGTLGAPPGSPTPGRGPVSYPALGSEVRAWIDRVGTPTEGQWVEVVGASVPAIGASAADTRTPVSVRMRLNVGNNEVFDLAFLTVTTNCQFCHFHIRGDMGSIGFFRPGWGTENSDGYNSGSGSNVSGDIYVARNSINPSLSNVSDDFEPSSGTPNRNDNLWQDQRSINGMTYELAGPDGIPGTADDAGDDGIQNTADDRGLVNENYSGPKLPEDTIGNDGIPDFPSFDPAKIKNQALAEAGSVYAGPAGGTGVAYAPGVAGAWTVPHGSDFDGGAGAVPLNRVGQSGVVEGNLVLVGTDANPIELNGNVFVTGDIIIRGPVKAGTQGALYAGRNVYIAGDVTYQDDFSGGYPLESDADGRAAVGENLSELRLAARNNIVVGDWTYKVAGNESQIQRLRDRQAQDFMVAQFNLNSTRYYEADPSGAIVSNELTYDPGQNKFFNDLGKEVPSSNVVQTNQATTFNGHPSGSAYLPVQYQRYDATMAPGNLLLDSGSSADPTTGARQGVFQPWMSQTDYQGVLGTNDYDYVGWRMPKPGGANAAAIRAYEYGPEWTAANGNGIPTGKFDKDALEGGEVGMYLRDQGTLKVGEISNTAAAGGKKVTAKTQVQHIDAFLFANKRIAGLTIAHHMTINGGMAAREIGVLAPGLQNWAGLVGGPNTGDPVPSWAANFFNPNHASHPKNRYGDPTNKTRLYYDYRLRNGGFGFEFLAKTGDATLYFRGGRQNPAPSVNGGAF